MTGAFAQRGAEPSIKTPRAVDPDRLTAAERPHGRHAVR
jgi:hypothetical protein